MPIYLRITKEADIVNINIDNAPAAPRDCSIGSCAIKYNAPASTAIATVIAIIEPIPPFTVGAAFSIRANIPISILRAATAPANLEPSINERAATATAITPIATAIAIMLPMQFWTPLAACIIRAITDERMPTAITPLAKAAKSIHPSIIATPANIAIAADIAMIVAEILPVSLPTNLQTNANPATTPAKNQITFFPFSISCSDIPARILITPANISIDADIVKRAAPRPFTVEPPANLATKAKPANIPINANIGSAAFSSSSADKREASFTTNTIKAMAIAIFINALPNLSIFLLILRYFCKNAIAPSITAKPIRTDPPCSNSDSDILPVSFNTKAIIARAEAIFKSTFPSLSIFCAALPFTNFPYAAIKIPKATTIPANAKKPRFA